MLFQSSLSLAQPSIVTDELIIAVHTFVTRLFCHCPHEGEAGAMAKNHSGSVCPCVSQMIYATACLMAKGMSTWNAASDNAATGCSVLSMLLHRCFSYLRHILSISNLTKCCTFAKHLSKVWFLLGAAEMSTGTGAAKATL